MGHSPKKKIKVVVERLNKDSIREEDGRHKGKLPYITSIIMGAPRSSMSPKGAIKRKIVELMVVSIKKGSTLSTNPKRPFLEFRDNEKVRGISSKIFHLVIIVTISNFYVSRVLNDIGNSCDIMYVDLFEIMGLKKEKLLSYEG